MTRAEPNLIRRLSVAFIVLALLTAACSGDATEPTEATEATPPSTAASTTSSTTTTTVATTTTTAATTTTAPSTTSSSTTTTTLAPSAEGPLFVVANALVLGFWEDGAWVEPDPDGVVIPPLLGTELAAVDGTSSVVVGADPIAGCFPESSFTMWYLDDFDDGLFINAGVPDPDRTISEISPSAAHVDAINEVLINDGVDAEVEINRVLRFDLEGDGVDEVLIQANRITGESLHGLPPGNYSILLFRRVVGNAAENVIVHADTDPPPADQADSITLFEIIDLLDANGDGVLELAIEYRGYEWGGVSLYDLQAEPEVVLSSGCGA